HGGECKTHRAIRPVEADRVSPGLDDMPFHGGAVRALLLEPVGRARRAIGGAKALRFQSAGEWPGSEPEADEVGSSPLPGLTHLVLELRCRCLLRDRAREHTAQEGRDRHSDPIELFQWTPLA